MMERAFLLLEGVLVYRIISQIRNCMLFNPAWSLADDGHLVRDALEHLEYGKNNY